MPWKWDQSPQPRRRCLSAWPQRPSLPLRAQGTRRSETTWASLGHGCLGQSDSLLCASQAARAQTLGQRHTNFCAKRSVLLVPKRGLEAKLPEESLAGRDSPGGL